MKVHEFPGNRATMLRSVRAQKPTDLGMTRGSERSSAVRGDHQRGLLPLPVLLLGPDRQDL